MIILAALTMVLSGCVKALDKEINETDSTILKGRVVEGTNYSGIPNITVSVTNGLAVHNITTTDSEGYFELTIDCSKIDETYYMLLYGGPARQKKENLRGLFNDEYNYYNIVLSNVTLFQTDGATYQVAPTAGPMTYSDALAYCDELIIDGFSGWKLPSFEELKMMYEERNSIGGFLNDDYWSNSPIAYNGYNYHYYYDFATGGYGWAMDIMDVKKFVRPLRLVNW